MSRRIVTTYRNTRVPCICQIRTANIIKDGVVIGTIAEEMNDAGETDWVITPNYDNISPDKSLLISGIDLINDKSGFGISIACSLGIASFKSA